MDNRPSSRECRNQPNRCGVVEDAAVAAVLGELLCRIAVCDGSLSTIGYSSYALQWAIAQDGLFSTMVPTPRSAVLHLARPSLILYCDCVCAAVTGCQSFAWPHHFGQRDVHSLLVTVALVDRGQPYLGVSSCCALSAGLWQSACPACQGIIRATAA